MLTSDALIVVPRYQNAINVFFTFLFLILYTLVVNTPNKTGGFDALEALLFAFVFGFFFDEVTKMCTPYSSLLMVVTKLDS
jgi:hypothetical protein